MMGSIDWLSELPIFMGHLTLGIKISIWLANVHRAVGVDGNEELVISFFMPGNYMIRFMLCKFKNHNMVVCLINNIFIS